MKCIECFKEFTGRKDAKFCSSKCRVTFNRKADIVTDKSDLVVTASIDREPLENSQWFGSAETKTRAEIEAHYTLANFPLVRYHTSGGGGRGSYSPYPRNDPRSKAYA